VARAGTDEVVALLRERGLTVSVAESSAGGLIAAELSRLPGSSAWFRGGVVAYDAASKTGLLGIPEGLLVEHGSVSAAAAGAMADAALRLFGSDFGVGETSILGPGGGTAGKPVGMGYVAVAGAGGTHVRELRLGAARDDNRVAAVLAALGLLAEVVGDGESSIR
jgi:nicotinamide-nucleotide amidase